MHDLGILQVLNQRIFRKIESISYNVEFSKNTLKNN